VAILILLGVFILYSLRNLSGTNLGMQLSSIGVVLRACVIAALALGSAILWSRLPLSRRQLRIIELTVFGLIGAFFAWIQYELFHDGTLLRAAEQVDVARLSHLAAKGNALSWFLLIVIYGTFIPNTWRRCASVVGCMALVPMVVMAAGSLIDPAARGFAQLVVPDSVILIATASAIAVFGSYKIHQLHEKAYEAEHIGQYRLKQILGFGGMGAVYLAEHVMLRRPCAIKLIRADQAGDPRSLMRFEREVQATATLTHWNTVEIFDYGHAEDGTFYYVMEYLPGLNLEDLVEKYGPMPPERVVHFMRQVSGALREAHGIGLIHRDIKPSNIFATERGKVYDVAKLLDFGLVKGSALNGDDVKLTREGVMAGSPAFVSPEQAAGRHELDTRTDIYSLGAVAYFLLTGKLLFERQSPLQMLHAHAYEPLAPPHEFQEDVPTDLQSVILRCLEKDPANRYQNAESLEKALSECASADQWTRERAETWWRTNGVGGAIPSSNDAAQRDGATILVQS
jgi:serine/threonine-protein kinase